MSLLARNLARLASCSSKSAQVQASIQHSNIQTSSTAAGGSGYSELTDYNLFLWDRPDGFVDGRPHREHWWERRSINFAWDNYCLAAFLGCSLAVPYCLRRQRAYHEDAADIAKIAEERLANGILVDLFPDQKEALMYVHNREFFPDHDPHTYDPTIDREYFWVQ